MKQKKEEIEHFLRAAIKRVLDKGVFTPDTWVDRQKLESWSPVVGISDKEWDKEWSQAYNWRWVHENATRDQRWALYIPTSMDISWTGSVPVLALIIEWVNGEPQFFTTERFDWDVIPPGVNVLTEISNTDMIRIWPYGITWMLMNRGKLHPTIT